MLYRTCSTATWNRSPQPAVRNLPFFRRTTPRGTTPKWCSVFPSGSPSMRIRSPNFFGLDSRRRLLSMPRERVAPRPGRKMAGTPQQPATRSVFPPLGLLAVLLGAMIATFFGRLLTVGAGVLRGAMHLDYDAATWISTAYGMGLMFIGPFSVYLGGLLGPRRVLLASALLFTPLSAAMPLVGHF